MTGYELTWKHCEGRDEEGIRFSSDVCIHASGRILARVRCPVGDEYWWRLYFYCAIPDRVIQKSEEAYDFIDSDSARQFAERVLTSFDPLELAPSASERESAGKTPAACLANQ
jgi:hypothetical protein